MKKKESLLVVIMGIITVAVIFMGFTYNKNRKEELLNNNTYEAQSQSDSFNERKRNAEEKKKVEFLGAFEKNRDAKTAADFLQYIAYNKKYTTVAFYGNIKKNPAWASDAIDTVVQERNLKNLKKHFIPTESGRENEQLKMLTKKNPDVVFFAVPIKEDAAQESNEAAKEVFKTYDAIKENLPESLVVVLAPAPLVEMKEDNSEIIRDQVYMDEIVKIASENKVPLFNLHSDMLKEAETTKTQIATFYNEENQLNDAGFQSLKKAFISNLKDTIMDTSKAFHVNGKKAAAERIIAEEESSSEESNIEEPVEESMVEEESLEESVEIVESVEPEPEVSVEEPTWEEPDYEEPESTWTPPATNPAPTPQPTPNPPKPETEPEPKPEPKPEPEPEKDPVPESGSESDNENYEPDPEPNLTPPPKPTPPE